MSAVTVYGGIMVKWSIKLKIETFSYMALGTIERVEQSHLSHHKLMLLSRAG